MKQLLTLNKTKYNNITFSGLKSVEFSRDFNPKKNSNDYLTFNSVLISDAFKYLIKNRDVSLEFDKFKSESDGKVYTVLHYKHTPIKEKTGLWEGTKSFFRKIVDGNDGCKYGWLFGWVKPATGERDSLVDKILGYPVEEMQKVVEENL